MKKKLKQHVILIKIINCKDRDRYEYLFVMVTISAKHETGPPYLILEGNDDAGEEEDES